VAWGAAPGKLILFGEHAVVFGEPALATAIDLRTEVYARPHSEWLADGASLDAPRYRYVRAAATRAWTGGPLWIEIRSMIPSGSGLGSSAAVTVASLAALRALSKSALVPADIAADGFAVEHEVQGRASPIDTSAAVHGGGLLTARERGDGFLWSIARDDRRWFLHDVQLPPMSLVVGSTGMSSATGPLVAQVKALVDRDEKAAAMVREIGAITVLAVSALQDGDFGTVGILMARNHHLLNGLGVGHACRHAAVAAPKVQNARAGFQPACVSGANIMIKAPTVRPISGGASQGGTSVFWVSVSAKITRTRIPVPIASTPIACSGDMSPAA